MIFKLELEPGVIPQTGNELVELLEKAVKMVRYNIGPEPIRFTKGPIYDAMETERVGTWSIEETHED